MVLNKYALIESVLPQGYLSTFEFILFVLSVLLITAGGYIVNDLYDVQIDRINKPHKTYVGNTISKSAAWKLYLGLTFIGTTLAIYLCIKKRLPGHVIYYLIGIACLYFYSSYFQKKALIGNVIVAFLGGALIYLTYSFDVRFPKNYFDYKAPLLTATLLRIFDIKFYIGFSFLGTLIREIIKDLEDINGDYNLNYKTLPIILGVKRTRNITIVLSVIFLLGLMLFTAYYVHTEYYFVSLMLALIVLSAIYFIYRLWSAKTKKHFHYLSNLMKLILFFGILSMILFTFA
jgi:4-hydroxybenzoate polyprenyltransferase